MPSRIHCPRELVAKRSDGSHFPVEVAVSGAEMEGARMGVAVVRDITQRKADEKLARQALHDSLTGLPTERSCSTGSER